MRNHKQLERSGLRNPIWGAIATGIENVYNCCIESSYSEGHTRIKECLVQRIGDGKRVCFIGWWDCWG